MLCSACADLPMLPVGQERSVRSADPTEVAGEPTERVQTGRPADNLPAQDMIHPQFDAYSVEADSLVPYDASRVNSLHLYGYEYIDNLHFLKDPSEIIPDDERRDALVQAVSRRFKEAGWEGTGRISLLWIPPFVFPPCDQCWEGVVVWYIKQHEDGLSWLLSPKELPFEEFKQ